MSFFDVIDELYPRKVVAEQLKQFMPVSSNNLSSAKSSKHHSRRIQSAIGGRQQHANY